MAERWIVIRNWDTFQHKDVWKKSGGRPPWIKNYTKLLHNDAYLGLTPSQRGILHGLWLLRASSGPELNQHTTRRLLTTNQGDASHFAKNLDALNRAGFIEFLSHPISERVAKDSRPEQSRVEEKESTGSSNVYVDIAARLPISNELVTQRLIQAVGPVGEATLSRLRSLAQGLPEGAIAKVTESVLVNSPRNRVAYAIAALRDEAKQAVA